MISTVYQILNSPDNWQNYIPHHWARHSIPKNHNNKNINCNHSISSKCFSVSFWFNSFIKMYIKFIFQHSSNELLQSKWNFISFHFISSLRAENSFFIVTRDSFLISVGWYFFLQLKTNTQSPLFMMMLFCSLSFLVVNGTK